MFEKMVVSNQLFSSSLHDKLGDVLSDAVLEKARARVRKFETETDSILFKEGLTAVRELLQNAESLSDYATNSQFSEVKKELILRIKEINKIVMKMRGKRALPRISKNDEDIVRDIEKALRALFGNEDPISLSRITPLLLEARKD